jgi:SAM-dependent methyltransferase/uncharacterized protein YbaR (Trm112 family)
MAYIICPGCSGELALKVFRQDEAEIIEGCLICQGCNNLYPIVQGVPRLLAPDLLPKLVSGYGTFLKTHDLTHQLRGHLKIYGTDEKIAKGFEFEWQKHSRILPEHEKEFRHVLADVLPPDEFEGRVILDAGCGQGRFSYFSQQYGAKTVISFDLGEQVLISSRNLKGMDNVHVVQASIYNPPFKQVFDMIYSIGVIHHLPEPEKGFRKLFTLVKEGGKIFIWVYLVKEGGKIFIWVYGYSSIIPVIKFFRTVTLGRSVKFNRVLGFFLAIPLYIMNLFYNFIKHIPFCGPLAELLPFHMITTGAFQISGPSVLTKSTAVLLSISGAKTCRDGWIGWRIKSQAC